MNAKITLASILMATVCSWLLVGILYRIRRKSEIVRGYGIYVVMVLYLFCIVRVLLPIDFPFTQAIPVPGIFSDVYRILCFERYGGLEWPILLFFCMIWFGVAFVLLAKFIWSYRRTCRLVSAMEERKDEQCGAILQEVFKAAGKKGNVTVCYNEQITMPMGMGIMDCKILLPDQVYTDRELYFILMHEYTHLLNGDLKVKMLVYIFRCIFWWNPVVYLLDQDLERILEMKCDLCVTKAMPANEVLNYLQTIVSALKSCGKRRNSSIMNQSVSLGDGGKGEMIERFQFVADYQKGGRNSKWKMDLLILVFGVFWLASYSVLPAPSYEPPTEDIITGANSFEITPENSYLFFKDGKYYLHIEVDGRIQINEISQEAKKLYASIGIKIMTE